MRLLITLAALFCVFGLLVFITQGSRLYSGVYSKSPLAKPIVMKIRKF